MQVVKVNLSRLHKIIDRYNSNFNELNSEILSSRLTGGFVFTPSSKIENLIKFIEQLKEDAAKFVSSDEEIILILDKIVELKSLLMKKNSEVGIDALLVKSSMINRKISFYNSILINLKNSISSHYTREIDGDYEKLFDDNMSIFTEDNKRNSESFSGVSKEMVSTIEEKIKSLRLEKIELDDRISELNQTTFVEIEM